MAKTPIIPFDPTFYEANTMQADGYHVDTRMTTTMIDFGGNPIFMTDFRPELTREQGDFIRSIGGAARRMLGGNRSVVLFGQDTARYLLESAKTQELSASAVSRALKIAIHKINNEGDAR